MQSRGRIGNTVPSPTRNYNYNYITVIHCCSHHHHFFPTMFLRGRSQGARRHSPNLIEFNRNSLFHSKRYSRYLFYAKTIPDWLQCNWSSSPKMLYVFPGFVVFILLYGVGGEVRFHRLPLVSRIGFSIFTRNYRHYHHSFSSYMAKFSLLNSVLATIFSL